MNKQEELKQQAARLKAITAQRREAEKTLEKLAIQRDILRKKRDMLYDIRNIIGKDIMDSMDRIVRKYALLVEYRKDLKEEITTFTLTNIHLNTILEVTRKYAEEIQKAFDENQIERAKKLLEDTLALLRTAI